tara:strand:- start:1679 stop:1852 length:174 start_codon:yes stop_codon:yes gene_type:complete
LTILYQVGYKWGIQSPKRDNYWGKSGYTLTELTQKSGYDLTQLTAQFPKSAKNYKYW